VKLKIQAVFSWFKDSKHNPLTLPLFVWHQRYVRVGGYSLRARFALSLLLTSAAYAASLKPESVQAWDRYVAAADARLEKSAHSNETFLWVDESPDRRRRVENGEIVVAETYSGVSKKAPSALIHDWMGAAFVAGAKIEDVIAVVRNYANYPEYYHPGVVSVKVLAQDGMDDRFSLLLVNQAVLVKTAVEAECHSTLTRVSDKRWYGKTSASRIQEVEDYGRANEHRLPVGEGGGYVWRLASNTRFQERDGGVYIELEAMALSRDVPLSLRFVIDPIVRRVSRNALAESLRQTDQAVTAMVATNVTNKLAGDRLAIRTRPINALGMAAINP
jgi:hypothetical protein